MNKGLIAGIVVGGVAVAGAATGLGVGLANNTAEYQVNIVSELESAEFEGNGTYQIGDQVELSAQDVEGYRFVYWSLPNGEISRENPYKFTLTNANYGTYTAVYEKEYTITVGEFSNGEITSDRPVAITGEEVTLTVTPDENYHVSNISYTTSSGTTTIEYSNGYKFLMPAEDVEITATFAQSAFNITKASMTNGDITLSNTSGVNGTEITVSAQPETGYELDQLYYIAQGSTTHVAITDNTFTLTSNVTVYATFKLIDYDFSFTNESETEVTIKRNGQIFTGSTVNYGDIITLEYTVSENTDVEIKVTGAIKEGNTYIVTGNLTITYEEEIVYDADTYETLSFTYDEETKTASVKENSANLPAGDLVIPNKVRYNEGIYKITSIRDFAFNNCANLENVTLSKNIEEIGAGSFQNCNNLNYNEYEGGKYISCPGNDYFVMMGVEDKTLETYTINPNSKILYKAFSNCKNLTSITIPSSVTSIGGDVFWYCTSLASITIPSSVISIGTNAFYGCESLTSVSLPSSVTSIGMYAFYNCPFSSLILPSSVINLGYGTFESTGLTTITIPNSVKIVGNNLFYNCKNLTSIIFEEGSQLTNISQYMFYDCKKLTSITIPASVTSIDYGAFWYCEKLASVVFEGENNLTNIGYGAFEYTAISTITIPSTVTSIGDYAFSWCEELTTVNFATGSQLTSIGERGFIECKKLNSITIPSGVTSLGAAVFENCEELTTIVIPKGVTSLNNYAFMECKKLVSVIFEEGSQLTKISNQCFSYCENLMSITIPESVTTIEQDAFYSCKSFTSIIIPKNVTSFASSALNGCDGLLEINVDENNANYKSINGVVFTKDGKTLVIYPAGREGSYIIPSGVTSIGNGAFSARTKLTSVIIPATVTEINSFAFSGCSNLTSVTFEEGSQLTIIASQAFDGCSSLTTITIPAGVTNIGYTVFSNCSSLQSILVDENNTVYKSVDGVLLSKDEKTLVLCPMGKVGVYTIPSGVTKISSRAFDCCSKLTSIIMPEGVTTIEQSAFTACSGLTTVTIPTTITSVGNYAFQSCRNIKTVVINSGYVYRSSTSINALGYLFQSATAVKVLKTVADSNTNTWLNGTAWTKAATTETIDGQEYYVYTKN